MFRNVRRKLFYDILIFFLSFSEDRLPPTVVVNKGLVMDENTLKKITTLQLSSTDQDSEPDELIYRITKQPQLGHLEHSSKPGTDKHPQYLLGVTNQK